jgi:Na+/H+-dicarboxylate symporter
MFGLQASTRVDGDGSATTSLNFNVLQIAGDLDRRRRGGAEASVERPTASSPSTSSLPQAIIHKMLWWVIRLTPIGTIGLLGNAVAVYGWHALAAARLVRLCHLYRPRLRALRSSIRCCCRPTASTPCATSPSAWPAIQLAFVSRSSIGTLPVTERVTEKSLGVPREYAAFAVPLGATTKMDGCAAIYPAISAIFVAQFFGITLDLQHYLLIVFVSVIGSAATAGLTGATVMLTLTLSTLGLPLEGVGLLLAIDPILDMGRTAVNVAGQALVPTIVAKRQGILDQAQYDRAGDIEAIDAGAQVA